MIHDPIKGVKRLNEGANEANTEHPALDYDQARTLLDAPPVDTLKGRRDRAILAVFLNHGHRCSEMVDLWVCNLKERRGVEMFKIQGEGATIRYIPAHPGAPERMEDYHGSRRPPRIRGRVALPARRYRRHGPLKKALSSGGIYQMVKH